MKKMAAVSCFAALCAAFDHPLQRQARALGRQAKAAQTPGACSMYTQAQLDKCSYGKTMRAMMSGSLTACMMNPATPECLAKADEILCVTIVTQQCLPEPANVQCGANDVGAFMEMIASPCDKITDPTQKMACTANIMNEISDDCMSCLAVNGQKEARGEAQNNCFASFTANQQCTWEGAAKVMNGFTCPDETTCNQYKAAMTDNDHVCLGCIFSIQMGPKNSKGEPTGSTLDCMSHFAKQQRPCRESQLDAWRDWGNCFGAASDAKDLCESAISDTDPDKEAKKDACDATEKAAQATCKQNFVSADPSYSNPDKITEGCSACYLVSMGKMEMCALPQRCTAADAAGTQAAYDCATPECREAAAKTVSGACRICGMQNKEKVEKDCTLPLVKDKDGKEGPDYAKCIPALNLCDLELKDGKVAYKPTPRVPTPPPIAPPTPGTPPKRRYRKLRALLKLAKKQVTESMKSFCDPFTDSSGRRVRDPQRCNTIAKELANKVFKALKQNLGDSAVTSVLVTHLCKLVGAATEITDTQKNDPNICKIVEEMSDAGRMASFLQTTVEGTLTAVYEMATDETLTPSTLTGVVDKAQTDGSLSVTDPVNGEDLVTGGDGTTGSTTVVPDTPAKDDDGSDIGMILGIVFGALAALGLVAVAAVVVSRKNASQLQGPAEPTAPMYHQPTKTEGMSSRKTNI